MVRLRLNNYVRRYTTLSSAIDTFVNHKLVLLMTWLPSFIQRQPETDRRCRA